MKNNLIIISLIFSLLTLAQEQVKKENINILRPSKAAFIQQFSLVLVKFTTKKPGKFQLFFLLLEFLVMHMILIRKNIFHTEMHIREDLQDSMMMNFKGLS